MSKVDTSSRHLYQQLLTAVGTWHSIVVVPASPDASAADVARALVDVTNLVRDKHAKLFSTEGLELAGVSKVIVEMMNHVDGGGLAVIALDSVVSKQSGVPVALAADDGGHRREEVHRRGDGRATRLRRSVVTRGVASRAAGSRATARRSTRPAPSPSVGHRPGSAGARCVARAPRDGTAGSRCSR